MAKILLPLVTLVSISYGIDGSAIPPLNIPNDSTVTIGKPYQETPSLLTAEDQDLTNNKLVSLGKFHVAEGTVEIVFSSLGVLGSVFVIANAGSNTYALTSGLLSLVSSSVTFTFGILEVRVGFSLQK